MSSTMGLRPRSYPAPRPPEIAENSEDSGAARFLPASRPRPSGDSGGARDQKHTGRDGGPTARAKYGEVRQPFAEKSGVAGQRLGAREPDYFSPSTR
jgi:hypothetical protein